MSLKNNILKYLINAKDFKGKYFLIRLTKKIFKEDAFLQSVYGVLLKENLEDYTWRMAYKGYADDIVYENVKSIPKGACFIDIGANYGLFSVLAAKLAGKDGLVISFEPNPRIFLDLVKNITHNKLDCTVIPFNMAIAEKAHLAYLSFDQDHSGTSHLLEHNENNSSPVPVSSFDDLGLLNVLIGEKDVYIKIDVEGAEGLVLRGISKFIKNSNVKKIILEVNDEFLSRFDTDRKDIYTLMQDCGFLPTINSNAEHYDEVFVRDSQ